jgi:hypothetical protein
MSRAVIALPPYALIFGNYLIHLSEGQISTREFASDRPGILNNDTDRHIVL